MNYKDLLDNEISDELTRLSELEVGSEEYKTAVADLTKLMDKSIDIEKISVDAAEKAKNREIEHQHKLEQIKLEQEFKTEQARIDAQLKQEQMAIEKKDKRFGRLATVVGIVVPVAVTIWGTLYTTKWERTDTLTTTAGKEHSRNLFKIFTKK